jgi:hypothetical protein
MYARADTYIEQGRNLDGRAQAAEALSASPIDPDDPPRAAAEKLLKKASGG